MVPWGSIDALAAMQRRLGVDILVSGHTHQLQVVLMNSPSRIKLRDKSYVQQGVFEATYAT